MIKRVERCVCGGGMGGGQRKEGKKEGKKGGEEKGGKTCIKVRSKGRAALI